MDAFRAILALDVWSWGECFHAAAAGPRVASMSRTGATESPAVSSAQQVVAIGMTLGSSLLVAAVPNFTKLAYDSGASVFLVIVGRSLIAVLLLGGALLVLRRSFAASRRVFRLCAVGGLASASMTFGFLSSVSRIDVSLAILIIYMYPVILGWLGHVRGTYRLTPMRLACCAIVLVGLALALWVRPAQLDPLGIALAAFGAVAAAALVIANADAVGEAGSIRVNLYTSISALGFVLIASLVAGDLVLPGTRVGWFGLLASGTAFCIGLALFFAAIPAIGMMRASLIGTVEPLFGILIAMALFDESLTVLQWIGVTIVLLGLVLLEVPQGLINRLLGRTPSSS
jgi:drug/metabolite transporter (DMT)-like permease